jgi:integrase
MIHLDPTQPIKLKHRRQRHQQGCLTIEKRKTGPDVWAYLYREASANGQRVQRKRVIGDKKQYPTKSVALRAVEALRIDINVESGSNSAMTVAALIAHYKQVELGSGRHTARVQQTYRHNLDDIILPEWGRHRLQDVMPIAVERWLGKMSFAPATKNKVKGVFGTLFRHGMRYRWAATNPIALVRCSSKRVDTPDVLTPAEIRAILAELTEPARTLTLLAAITGIRRGELVGLKWEDLDFEHRTIRIVRSLVDQIEGKPKTETSRKPLPMSDELENALSHWREQTSFAKPSDWVFASPMSFGKLPYWPDMILRRHIVPAAKRVGILKRIGWHTFRRSAASLLMSSGSSVKTTQELMRHATADITMELYAQAVTEDKRKAQNVLAALITGATLQGAETRASA